MERKPFASKPGAKKLFGEEHLFPEALSVLHPQKIEQPDNPNSKLVERLEHMAESLDPHICDEISETFDRFGFSILSEQKYRKGLLDRSLRRLWVAMANVRNQQQLIQLSRKIDEYSR